LAKSPYCASHITSVSGEHDSETGEEFVALHHLDDCAASFTVHNSPLSEGSVLGFEFFSCFAVMQHKVSLSERSAL
jgi:2-oxoglutarate dehydrogenase complex dehydrogenase (E1) component-like enzyme